MAVDSKHEEYEEHYDQWERCEHATEGQDEIHEYGVKYLPRLSGQTDQEYKSYKLRALFYNATQRTIDGLTGLMFIKPPTTEYPAGLEALTSDVTMSGVNLHQFAEMVAEEVVMLGRCGVLVDHPPNAEALTLAQAQSLGMRPYMRLYEAESIINWRTQRIGDTEMLTLVVLEEDYEVQKDEFKAECETQWRVLDIAPAGYRQRVFRKNDRGEFYVVEEIYPLSQGKPIARIPFEFFGVRDNTPCVDKPPLLDLVDVNLSHYRTTADYEHGLHFTGLPTPVVTGFYSDDQTAQLRIGSGTAWLLPDPAAKAFYLEFTGQGLSELREALRAKEAMMATLGARILAPERKVSETAQAAAIHQAGENSVLASMAQSISIGITHCLEYMANWAGIAGDVRMAVNRDYLPNSMTYQDVAELVKSWQAGAISHETLFDNLVKGDLISEGISFMDEKERIDMTPPGMPTSA